MSELRDRVLTIPVLEKKLAALQDEMERANEQVSDLLSQFEQERRDVEKLQKESLSSFLLQLVGRYEDRLVKEQGEEIAATLAYDRAVTHLYSLTRDKETLASRISDLRVEEQKYYSELENRRQELANQAIEEKGIQYAALAQARSSIISQITEIREALSAAALVKETAQSARDSLKSAEGWATYDVFGGGGIISHIAKYSHIDRAEQSFHTLSTKLRDFKEELKDVSGLTVLGLSEISEGQRAVDFWFDNIFTDLSVRRQIRGNAEEIDHLLTKISVAASELKAKLREAEEKLEENRLQEEALLLS
ncbi:MAG: hypothetical protein LIO58_06105 [Oscillospiraceae bacterium]|nr:hypothetical protein [Oscillospiraceae bacterium]